MLCIWFSSFETFHLMLSAETCEGTIILNDSKKKSFNKIKKEWNRWWRTKARWQRTVVSSKTATSWVQAVQHMATDSCSVRWVTDGVLVGVSNWRSVGGPFDPLSAGYYPPQEDRSVNQAVALRIAFNLVSPLWLMIYPGLSVHFEQTKRSEMKIQSERERERAGWTRSLRSQSKSIRINLSLNGAPSVSIRISPSNLKPDWWKSVALEATLPKRLSSRSELKETIFNIWKTPITDPHSRNCTSKDTLLKIHF